MAELPFEDAKLLPENHDLQPQGTIGSSAGQQRVENQADKPVDQGENHRSAIMPDSARLPQTSGTTF